MIFNDTESTIFCDVDLLSVHAKAESHYISYPQPEFCRISSESLIISISQTPTLLQGFSAFNIVDGKNIVTKIRKCGRGNIVLS